jgi:nucleotidyltransferase substrate binding protein (TIGR01987 family)
MEKNIRWKQRFSNYSKALSQLELFMMQPTLNHFEEQGFIKAFEYTYELAWKTLQDFYKERGFENIIGPKPVIEQSFQDGIIVDGKGWIAMHLSRNLTSHTYNEETANEIVFDIRTKYFNLFKELHNRLSTEI